MAKDKIIGVDIGGSHISAGWVDFSKGIPNPLIKRSKVNSKGNREEILTCWAGCLKELGPDGGTKLGIAMPAPFDYESGISLIKEQGKFLSLYQVNIKDELSARLSIPKCNVFFINDAAAFLQGEAFVSRYREDEHLMGLTLGTGLGSAFRTGHLAVDGELWSSPYKAGIAEDYLGTGWFIEWAKKEMGVNVSGLKDLLENPLTKLRAPEALKKFGQNLGEFVIPYIKEKKIERIILGGNISNAADIFLPATISTLKMRCLFPKISTSRLGEKAPMIGAASICK